LVLILLAIDGGGWNPEPDSDRSESTVDMVDEGVSFIPLMLLEIDLLEELPETAEPFRRSASGVSRETIFIPTLFPVEAGMKRVVIPCFLIIVLCGW